ncbi:MAG: response regulator [Rhodocyclaceae bacterium]|nr:response regulator [Rhodocyclaceae bacterium]
MIKPILVVDDEPINLAAMRQILADEHALVYGRSGHEAIELARKHAPVLILLDVQMPDIDGYEVCRRLKADPMTASIPVIFVTSLSEVTDEMRAFESGAVDFITKPVSPPIVKLRVRNQLSLVSAATLETSYHDAIKMLGAASEFKDTDTGVHIWRMAAYSARLAQAAGWDDAATAQMMLAAPMHDLGKLGIPDNILHKPGKLDAEEWEVMQTHANIGYRILASSKAPILQMAATIARYHHERWDGSGYPCGLSGEDIPEMARIVAIADVFDALTMDRPYKEAWPIERVIETIRDESGTHFDPRLTDLFLSIMPDVIAIREQWQNAEAAASFAQDV